MGRSYSQIWRVARDNIGRGMVDGKNHRERLRLQYIS